MYNSQFPPTGPYKGCAVEATNYESIYGGDWTTLRFATEPTKETVIALNELGFFWSARLYAWHASSIITVPVITRVFGPNGM